VLGEGMSSKGDSKLLSPMPDYAELTPCKLLTRAPKNAIIELDLHAYLMTKRQTLIMELGALEDILGIDRSIPKRKR
jgi:hypothetical protein